MPRTRPELNREQKVAEILEVAERRLREAGFEGLSMAGIARELGLAQNAVYWYFPSRAELFVAALERILAGIAARKPRGEVDVVERILWWTDQFAPVYALRPAMYEQARESAVVADFVERLDGTLERMLANTFGGRVPPDELPQAIESFRSTVIGTYAQGLPRARRRKLLAFALSRLIDA